jgi:succinyl-diaminopimelate desuccinylase
MSGQDFTDPIALAQALIRCPSVTPEDAGAQSILRGALEELGFVCHVLSFESPDSPRVRNLYARLGTGAPNFCFAGHTDVVPPGDESAWKHGAFAGEIAGGMLWGRGAADMKSAIAAFVAATARRLATEALPFGSISLLVTGDEEGAAVNGTVKVLSWLRERGERLDHCLIGEPTSATRVGDVIKIGRRGSMNFRVAATGTQGHVAYPALAANPIPAMAELVGQLTALTLDQGSDHFEPSTLAFTTIDTGNPAVNVIPAELRAGFNIRFNDRHTPETLRSQIRRIADAVARENAVAIDVQANVSGVSFITAPGPYTELLADAVRRVTGRTPEYSTGGGTSDARFIKDHCPVAELGLIGATMHKADECAGVAEIETLTRIYRAVLDLYFAGAVPGGRA